MYAIENKDLEFVNFLLEKKADPNKKCKFGNTPMHFAFKY